MHSHDATILGIVLVFILLFFIFLFDSVLVNTLVVTTTPRLGNDNWFSSWIVFRQINEGVIVFWQVCSDGRMQELGASCP